MHLHVVGAINQSRDRIRYSRREEDDLEQRKRRYCRQLRQLKWNDAKPFVIDARMWTINTAERYVKRRELLISKYRGELVEGYRLLHDEDIDS